MIYQMIYSLLSLCMLLPTELSNSYHIFNTYKLYVGLQGTIFQFCFQVKLNMIVLPIISIENVCKMWKPTSYL